MVHLLAQMFEGQGGPLIDPELLFHQGVVVALIGSFYPRVLCISVVCLVSVWGVDVDHLLTQYRAECGSLIDTIYIYIHML